MKQISIQGVKYLHKFNLPAFEGDKGLKKEAFEKKYKGRLDTKSAWNKIQEALNAKKESEAIAKKETKAKEAKIALAKEAKIALNAKKAIKK